MPSQPVKPDPLLRRPNKFALLMVLAVSVFAAVALFAPRAIRPSRLPVLTLDPAAAEAAMAKDRARAGKAPSGRWVSELLAVHARIGRGSQEAAPTASSVRAAYRLAARRARTVQRDHGDEALWALRARAVVQLERALDGEMPARARHELMGAFEEQLVRYGVRSESGDLRAPALVPWTMFKARWNMISGLAATAGFEPIEIQAYQGWLALHADGAPAGKRLEAARMFEQAGGAHGGEALAIWAMRTGQLGVARDALSRALEREPSVRLRNYALALADASSP